MLRGAGHQQNGWHGLFHCLAFLTCLAHRLDWILFQEVIERPKLDVVAVDTIQRRASPRTSFKDRKKPIRDLDLSLLFFRKRIEFDSCFSLVLSKNKSGRG